MRECWMVVLPQPPAGGVLTEAGLTRSGTVTGRRCLLDTFDWRLFRAQWLLVSGELPASGSVPDEPAEGLALWSEDRGRLEAYAPGPVGESVLRVEQLPGPIAIPISDLVEPRALLPRVCIEFGGERWEDEAGNRVQWEALFTRSGEGAGRSSSLSPPVLAQSRCELIGVWVQARAAPGQRLPGALIALGKSLRASALPEQNLMRSAAAAQGLQAGRNIDTHSPPLEPAMTAGKGFAQVLRDLGKSIRAQEEGLRQDVDPEFLHDFRVGIRSARAHIGGLPGILPEAQEQAILEDLAWIGQISGPARDMDVQFTELKRELPSILAQTLTRPTPLELPGDVTHAPMAAETGATAAEPRRPAVAGDAGESLPPSAEITFPDPGTVEGSHHDPQVLQSCEMLVLEGMETLRRRARAALLEALESPRYQRLWTNWDAAVEALEAGEGGLQAQRPMAVEAGRAIWTAYRRLRKAGSRLQDEAKGPSAEALHRLRKRTKRLRYLIDHYGALAPGVPLSKARKSLKKLQELLGRHQDLAVSEGTLLALSGLLVERSESPVVVSAAVLSLGALLARMEAERTATASAARSQYQKLARSQMKDWLRPMKEAA